MTSSWSVGHKKREALLSIQMICIHPWSKISLLSQSLVCSTKAFTIIISTFIIFHINFRNKAHWSLATMRFK